MRNYGLVALLFIVLCPALRAQHGGVSAGRLRAAYEASVGEGGRLRQRLFFDAFLSLTLVAYAFKGIQVCVIWLILSAGLKMLKQMKKTAFNIIIISITLICMIVFSLFAVKFSTIFYILISGACGVAVYLLGKIRKEEKQ